MKSVTNILNWSRRRRTAMSVSCPCLVFVRKILSVVCLLSGFCPDFLSGVCLTGFGLSRFCPDFKEKGCLVSVCPEFFYLDSVRCRDFVWIFKKLCPWSVCPTGQGQDRAVRTFAVLDRRRLNWSPTSL